MTKATSSAVAFGLVLTALFWIDPLFIPLVLLAPPLTGAIAARRRMPLAWIAAVWLVAGMGAIVSDYLINRSDVVFHAVLTVFVVGLAVAAWALANRIGRTAAEPAA
jgi:hypothetical protein